jgi:glucose/mannose transport system substrate-binding protein
MHGGFLDMSFPANKLSRRAFTGAVAGAVAAAPFLRAGAQSASPSPVANVPLAVGTPESELEIFSWWTSGGEAAGLQKLFDAFTASSPNVKIVNAAVAGGAGSNAKAALQTRLSGGQPPDSWQSHPGKELSSLYVDPGYCLDIDSLYAEQGWGDVIPKGLLDQVTFDSKKYLIPVGIHRGNVLFYDKKLMSDNGITIGDTLSWDDFWAAADKLKAVGVPAIALGDKDTFAAPMFFENTLLGVLGPEKYTGLWNGDTKWDDDGVKTAVGYLAKAIDYLNPDHAALTWDGAADLLIDGKAAFTSMGDWAYGEFVSKKAQDGIGWVTHPGSDASFVTVVDGFTLPKNAPHPVNAANWLRNVGSAAAQETFSPLKGCIPARTDIDKSKFSGYFSWSIDGLATATSVPSMAHGAAASPQWQQTIFDATVAFLVDKDQDTYIATIKQGAEDDGISQ